MNRNQTRPHFPERLNLDLDPDAAQDSASLRRAAAYKLQVEEAEVPPLRIRQRALDARKGRVRYRLTLEPVGEAQAPLGGAPLRPVAGEPAIIVGGGPAGLFCAYALARHGVASVVVERGKPVQPRRHDLKALQRLGRVDPDSNYCFGEGGAGTYSDGKLYTRATKRGDVRDVLELLVLHGAAPDILVDTRPHVGSNRLPKVVTRLREQLSAVGVHFEFGRRVVGLLTEGTSPSARVCGVRTADGLRIRGREVVLATGHSARDVFELLLDLGLPLESKAFALGVRIEHPQPLINRIQYGEQAGHPNLPSAAYRLATATPAGDVFSFCMCPGGFVVPACTEGTGLVVNGMSLSRRDSPYANSGLVCATHPKEWLPLGLSGPLAGVVLQRRLEAAALQAGDPARLAAPASRVTDFLAGRASTTVPNSSYLPGLVATELGSVLAAGGLPLAHRLRHGLRAFDRRLRGYITEEAVVIGVESRTSAPVRIPRDPATLEAARPGLYPCGEGAGYAGGIVSAALDGMRVASAIARARMA